MVKGGGNRWTFDSRQPEFEAPVTRQMYFVATDAAGRSTTIPFSFVVPEHHVGVTWVLPTKDDPYQFDPAGIVFP